MVSNIWTVGLSKKSLGQIHLRKEYRFAKLGSTKLNITIITTMLLLSIVEKKKLHRDQKLDQLA